MTRYITTPLYYVNAMPHLGHFYTTQLADTLTRHYRQRGDTVYFLTGTDEHGQKVADMAKKNGEPNQAFVDRISHEFQKTWQACDLHYDRFYRTTEANHIQAVQHALQFLKDKGEIVFREYEGLYDVGSERFVKESELTPDGLSPDTLTKPEYRKESNYFFLMSRYQNRLIELFENQKSLILPDHYRNEILSFLKNQPLEDLCISRPTDRMDWGIPLPFDKKYVTYVWFDALMNYLIATGWPNSFDQKLWESCTHLIAKDIVKTHSIYWMAMLLALEVPPYKGLRVHGYWLVNAQKMSKTIGNVVRPLEIKEKFGLENLRFYLMKEMSFGFDATFTLESFIQCSNAYLANGIGNLASRVMTLCLKNFKGNFSEKQLLPLDQTLLAKRAMTLKSWDESFEDLKFHNALKAWAELVTATDLYINETKPWALAKSGTTEDQERLGAVLGVALNVLETLGLMIEPVLPQASQTLLKSLGISDSPTNHATGILDLKRVSSLRTEYSLSSTVPKLFARIQLPEPLS